MTAHLQKLGHVHSVTPLIESRVRTSLACPKWGHSHIAHRDSASGLQRYRCKVCKAAFNALTETPLARLQRQNKWLDYAQQLADGHSVRNSASACDVHRNTALRWHHRFLVLPTAQKATSLVSIAEIDETFFLDSFKGKKQGLGRAPVSVAARRANAVSPMNRYRY
jgi:transposase-like protein